MELVALIYVFLHAKDNKMQTMCVSAGGKNAECVYVKSQTTEN